MLRLTDNELVWIVESLREDISIIDNWDDYFLSEVEVQRIIDKLNYERIRLDKVACGEVKESS